MGVNIMGAERKTSKKQSIEMTKNALKELEKVSQKGLPEIYETLRDFLTDWYPNLPWDIPGSKHAFMFLLKDKIAKKIAVNIKKRFRYNIYKEWIMALREIS